MMHDYMAPLLIGGGGALAYFGGLWLTLKLLSKGKYLWFYPISLALRLSLLGLLALAIMPMQLLSWLIFSVGFFATRQAIVRYVQSQRKVAS